MLYPLPKPAVVVQILLDQFSDVFIRVASILCSDAIQLSFEFWGEVNFHAPRLPAPGTYVNGEADVGLSGVRGETHLQFGLI